MEISLFHFFRYFLTTHRNFHREILSRLNEFSPKLLHRLFRETFPAILVLVIPEYNQQNAVVSGGYLSSSVSLVMANFHVKPKPNLTYNFLILLLYQLSIFSLYYLETKNKILSDRSKVTIKTQRESITNYVCKFLFQLENIHYENWWPASIQMYAN